MNYQKIANEIASLLTTKNEDYGDAINRTAAIVRILFRQSPDIFDKRIQIIIRVLDKVCRECTKSDIENWKDIAGYAIRMVAELESNSEDLKELAKADQPIVEGHSARSEIDPKVFCKHKWDYSDPYAWECKKCGELCTK